MDDEFLWTIANFQKVLERQGFPKDIVWVVSEKIVYFRGYWILLENGKAEEADVMAAFRAARKQLLGADFRLIGVDKYHSYCYLLIPLNEIDAEYKLMANGRVKFSIPERIPNVVIEKSGILATWYKFRGLQTKNNFKRLYLGY